MNNLALVLKAQGDLDTARQFYEQALEVSRRTLGPEHPNTLKLMNTLALVLKAQGAQPQARQIRQQLGAVQQRRWVRDATSFIELVVAAARGDGAARVTLASTLTHMRVDPAWTDLATLVQRMLDGERYSALLAGLDEQDTTIAAEILRRLSPPDNEP